jgi:hypothetical protein
VRIKGVLIYIVAYSRNLAARDLAQQRFFVPQHKAKRRESSTKPAIKSRQTNRTVTNGPPGAFKNFFKKVKKKLVTPENVD